MCDRVATKGHATECWRESDRLAKAPGDAALTIPVIAAAGNGAFSRNPGCG
jgi:hypothetical protein